MAVANFFDRTLSSAAGILSGFDARAFEAALMSQHVDIAFDRQAEATHEGRAALDLLVRLVARLYPRISVTRLGRGGSLRAELVELAQAINPDIEFVGGAPTVRVVAGRTPCEGAATTIYMGSSRWLALLSTSTPVGSGQSGLAFGAGGAACLAAANVFRAVFGKQLTAGALDDEVCFSSFDFTTGEGASNPRSAATFDLGEAHLVGLGAIGNGVVWALQRTAGLGGKLDLIDHEPIELSNLQRYVLALQCHLGVAKAELAEGCLAQSAITAKGFPHNWQTYLAERGDWRLERVAVALDSAADRILVQGSLPKRILNSWTQAGDLGVSRHSFDGPGACLACLYLPKGEAPHEDELIANAVGIPEPESRMGIRLLLQTGQPVGEQFVHVVAARLGIDVERLLPYAGEPLRRFYSQAICGGMLLRLNAAASGAAEAPLAFQSALAGVMLAAELVVDAANARAKPLKTKTVVDVTRPLGKLLTSAVAKAKAKAEGAARCLCGDPDFTAAYATKYGGGPA